MSAERHPVPTCSGLWIGWLDGFRVPTGACSFPGEPCTDGKAGIMLAGRECRV